MVAKENARNESLDDSKSSKEGGGGEGGERFKTDR